MIETIIITVAGAVIFASGTLFGFLLSQRVTQKTANLIYNIRADMPPEGGGGEIEQEFTDEAENE